MTEHPPMFIASRQAGLDRLQAFLPMAGTAYARQRSLVVDGHPHVSRLSPYLRHRLVTEEEVLAALDAQGGQKLAEKFVSEVLWRSYWKGFLQMRPILWQSYVQAIDAHFHQLSMNSPLYEGWTAACAGETGIDGFDDWARELVSTGYLHNQVRMWFASIWVHTLRLPWELGADFFLRHLLDGDPASNTLSWRWVAGLHTPGKFYLANAETISHNTGGRYCPSGLATEPVTSSGLDNPVPGPCPQGGRWDKGLPTALLLHEDDLCPEFMLQKSLVPDQTAFLLAPKARSPLPTHPRLASFITEAMEDCAQRIGPGLGSIHGPVAGKGAVDALVSWARATNAVQIVTPFAPVGPIADILDELDLRLASENIRLIRVMREYDAKTWPLATAGFFPFRKAFDHLPR